MAYLVDKGYATQQILNRAHRQFDKYGAWALLLSWMPIIGDPITLIAGVTAYDFRKFVWLVLLAKSVRYGVVIALYLQLL